MDGFVGNAGFRRDFLDPVADVVHADVLEAYGQTDFEAEADDGVDLFVGGVLEHELADGAEGDLLAVIILVGFFQHGQTVVDRVRSREAAGLEAETGEQDVGFDDVFERGSDDVAFAGEFRLVAVG